jgi:hypothetical protein
MFLLTITATLLNFLINPGFTLSPCWLPNTFPAEPFNSVWSSQFLVLG